MNKECVMARNCLHGIFIGYNMVGEGGMSKILGKAGRAQHIPVKFNARTS
jgi:hypothetical protein